MGTRAAVFLTVIKVRDLELCNKACAKFSYVSGSLGKMAALVCSVFKVDGQCSCEIDCSCHIGPDPVYQRDAIDIVNGPTIYGDFAKSIFIRFSAVFWTMVSSIVSRVEGVSTFPCRAYDGWDATNFVTGEMRNAEKNLPRVIHSSMFIVVVSALFQSICHGCATDLRVAGLILICECLILCCSG